MRLTALHLLGHGMKVAEPPFIGSAGEDRGRAGGVVDRVGGALRFVDRVRGGEANSHALRDRQIAAGDNLGPYIVEFAAQEATRRVEANFRPRVFRLHHRVLAQRARAHPRRLRRGQFGESVEHRLGDADRDAGKPARIKIGLTEQIERRVGAAFLGIISVHREFVRYEDILHNVAVAGGAAQSDNVPYIFPYDLFGRNQHGPNGLAATFAEHGVAIAVDNRGVGADIGRVPPAAGEHAIGVDPVSIAFLDGFRFSRPPGQHTVRIVAPDRIGGLILQE